MIINLAVCFHHFEVVDEIILFVFQFVMATYGTVGLLVCYFKFIKKSKPAVTAK